MCRRYRVEPMPFDGPAGILMQASGPDQADQQNNANEAAVFFVNVRQPLRRFDHSLPARRRPQGIVIIGVCLSVCAHCFCPQDISRTGSWITTKFGGWDQGVNL